MTAEANVQIEPGDEIVVARVSGEIDVSNASAVGIELAEAVGNRALGMVLDLGGTTYFDSSGVSLLFDLAERLRRRQQQLRVVVPEGQPLLRVLNIVGAPGAARILGTVAEAEADIRAGA